jgi:hypothetical protein
MSDSHDGAVAKRINGYVRAAHAQWAKSGGTVGDILVRAVALSKEGRRGPTDIVGRDAEYYLMFRAQVADSEWTIEQFAKQRVGDLVNICYNLGKAGAIGLGLEPLMRTDPDVPVTPPGISAVAWGHLGGVHGKSDSRERVGMPHLLDPSTLLVVPGAADGAGGQQHPALLP